jgi:uncharacterized protein DUF6328
VVLVQSDGLLAVATSLNVPHPERITHADATNGGAEELPLSKAAEYLLDECRMVLPGIQALFGFQLIAVFSARFAETLSLAEQQLHFVAIGLVAVAVTLIMTPAALHRHSPRQVTARFIRVSTRLLMGSMGLGPWQWRSAWTST